MRRLRNRNWFATHGHPACATLHARAIGSGNLAGVVQAFYDAFRARDGEAMAGCYADDATFRDEVFDLHGREEIGAMWQMLLTRGKDLELEVGRIEEDPYEGRAHWEAHYTFGATGNKVHNIIDAEFDIRDGLIVQHIDKFDFWRWSRQALGPVGVVLGWSPFVRTKVQAEAARGLETFRRRGV